MKDLKRKVNATIEVLTALSQHQGYAGIGVFDGGIDEGSFGIQINLERDGALLKQENLTPVDFRRLLVELLSSSAPHLR